MGKIKIILVLTISAVLLISCGPVKGANKDEVPADPDSAMANEPVVVTVLNNKEEVSSQLNSLASAFNASQTGIKVEIQSVYAGVDVQSTLKGYYLAGKMPDIITCEVAGFANWEGLLVDLSDQEWVADTDAEYVDNTYGTLGFPYTTEAIGFAYNADILSSCGIDPSTLTSPGAYEEAFALIDSKKEELGLTAVVGYCAEKENLFWSTGNHLFGAYLDSGLARDDTSNLDLLEAGQFDEQRLSDFTSFIGLLNRYSDPDLLTTGSYDEQVQGFASGKYAFVTQGSWIGVLLSSSENYTGFSCGMAPYAFQDGIDTILTSSPAWWAVSKEGNVEEAKAFLNWCASDEGQKIFVEQCGYVSPYKSCSYIADDPFAQTITDYLAAGKTSSWHWMNLKEGCQQYYIAPAFYNYAAGVTDAQGFMDELKAFATDIYAL
ncbi:MAG: ABC transporter substrate-binding protein [Pseudobutyrivibrio sp.]|nr:ABC transporter substrate-binding protein [Pseudobutyrivibrio sp.]